MCGGILYLESGSLKVYLQGDDGNEITLYSVEAGEQCAVNTSSAISKTPALGSAVALSDIDGYILETKSVKEMMSNRTLTRTICFPYFP